MINVWCETYSALFAEIAEVCRQVGTEALCLLTNAKEHKTVEDIQKQSECLRLKIKEVAELVEELTLALKGDSIDILEDLVEGELVAMEKAIEEAAKRMEVRFNVIAEH